MSRVCNIFWECYKITGGAFRGTDIKKIVIPYSVTYIGYQAFYNCQSLDCIEILNPECVIYDSEETITNFNYVPATIRYFSGTVCGYNSSTAYDYSQKYNYSFKSLGEQIKGDVDGDGSVTSADALAILNAVTGSAEFSDSQKILADLDSDGQITAADALIVLQMVVGLN